MPDRRTPPPSRRRYLRSGAALLAAGTVAGCLGQSGPSSETGTAADTTSGSTDATDTPASSRTGAADSATPTEVHADYETTEVRVTTPDGDRLGSVTAAIADTRDLRYLGLSDTEHLPEDRGMLFVYDALGDRTFVMREMDFGIDIVYADGEGVITTVHHAPAPGPDEDGNEQRYPGRGRYVLEVTLDWTTDRGVGVGDVLQFEL